VLIKGRRIRNLERHLGPVRRGTNIVIALADVTGHRDTLEQAGFAASARTPTGTRAVGVLCSVR
jgi:hypothetical protein